MLSNQEYQNIKEQKVQGRYVVMDHIEPILQHLPKEFLVEEIGFSVENKSIKSVTVGTGSKRILMWSQMHGNESTTTKAVLDLLQYLQQDTAEVHSLKNNCTLKIIPILNPDGAFAYTRINANSIDLNRDAQNQSQPESVVLKNTYHSFGPDYCFNLHDQRTIFNVGNTKKPATVSFLAPAHDPERSISATRAISMQLIVAMHQELQKRIPGQIGRYDDGFNSNCVGDAFQMLNTPTILFESGHYYNDYEREKTREFIFYSLLKGIGVISKGTISSFDLKEYTKIPENGKQFFDILVHNAELLDPSLEKGVQIGVLYKETLIEGKLEFVPVIEKIGIFDALYFGHEEFDCSREKELSAIKASVWGVKISKDIALLS